MSATVADRPVRAHPERSETLTRTANLDLRFPEARDPRAFRSLLGGALQRAFRLVGWSLKEAAGQIGRDPRQVARWLNGEERPQFDALFAVEALRQPLVQALGELAGADVEVTVRLRRSS